jgi:hypothetical protein
MIAAQVALSVSAWMLGGKQRNELGLVPNQVVLTRPLIPLSYQSNALLLFLLFLLIDLFLSQSAGDGNSCILARLTFVTQARVDWQFRCFCSIIARFAVQ